MGLSRDSSRHTHTINEMTPLSAEYVCCQYPTLGGTSKHLENRYYENEPCVNWDTGMSKFLERRAVQGLT